MRKFSRFLLLTMLTGMFAIIFTMRASASVGLTSYTVEYNPTTQLVEIRWVTATERNTIGFYVQRSIQESGGTWDDVGGIVGAEGTVSSGWSYAVDDNSSLTTGTTYYYRLQEKESGKADLIDLGIISIVYGQAGSTATATSQPTAQNTTVPTNTNLPPTTAVPTTAVPIQTTPPTPIPTNTNVPTQAPTSTSAPTNNNIPTSIPTNTRVSSTSTNTPQSGNNPATSTNTPTQNSAGGSLLAAQTSTPTTASAFASNTPTAASGFASNTPTTASGFASNTPTTASGLASNIPTTLATTIPTQQNNPQATSLPTNTGVLSTATAVSNTTGVVSGSLLATQPSVASTPSGASTPISTGGGVAQATLAIGGVPTQTVGGQLVGGQVVDGQANISVPATTIPASGNVSQPTVIANVPLDGQVNVAGSENSANPALPGSEQPANGVVVDGAVPPIAEPTANSQVSKQANLMQVSLIGLSGMLCILGAGVLSGTGVIAYLQSQKRHHATR